MERPLSLPLVLKVAVGTSFRHFQYRLAQMFTGAYQELKSTRIGYGGEGWVGMVIMGFWDPSR